MTFADPAEHLKAELQRLDLLLHREIVRLRAAYQLSLDEFRGLYVSDEQVDRLAGNPLRDPALGNDTDGTSEVEELTACADALRCEITTRIGPELPWSRVVLEWALSPFERDVLLLALAPEVDLKYETIYAYLNNDVTRKWPTCDLALRLFVPDGARDRARRQQLSPAAVLFRDGLLQAIRRGPERPSGLAVGFGIAPLVAQYLLEIPSHDPALRGFVAPCEKVTWDQVPLTKGQREQLLRVAGLCSNLPTGPAPIVILEGRTGTGRRAAATAICEQAALPLLLVDLEALRLEATRPGTELPRLVEALYLRQRLAGAALCLTGVESMWEKDGQFWPEGRRLIASLAAGGRPLFLVCEPGTPWQGLCRGLRCLSFSFADPDFDSRRRLWESALATAGAGVSSADVAMVAGRFLLMPDQIRAAVHSAIDRRNLTSCEPGAIGQDLLLEAARAQSVQGLGALAVKVPLAHRWDDLVLPAETLRHVREVVAAIRHRHVVYDEWGFGRRVPNGQGLKVLFAGPSGTGKTMTAGVIAGDLGLDLYRIDLSAVVSKYIGETEKHLERIFRAAHCSNVVLFFDEADALFGKRSEVKDAHDRYANVETAYLLQRIEEHEGIVILASNLTNNIDEAFRRRLHYVVDFPLPDEPEREKLWRGMLPAEVPLGDDVDLRFLAKQFALAGGDIRNVALDAAFLAAADSRVVRMRQLVQAVARQMVKQGAVPSAADFKQYYDLIDPDRGGKGGSTKDFPV
jgi:DNA polymerase III delta prime subunit